MFSAAKILIRRCTTVQLKTSAKEALRKLTTDTETVYKTKAGEKFLIQRATLADEEVILNYLKDVFCKAEPLSRALGIGDADSNNLLRLISQKSLKYPLSCIVRHADTGDIAGARLFSVGDRNSNEEIDEKLFTEKARIILDIVMTAENEFWKKVDPSINRIIWREITSIDNKHMRKGIANFLASHLITPKTIKQLRIQGMASVASSLANQQLLLKNGYQKVVEFKHSDYLDRNGKRLIYCDDGTDRVIVLFKKFT